MARKPLRIVVVEGRDDVAAFRALLRDEFPSGKLDSTASPGELRYETEKLLLGVMVAKDKDRLAERASDAVTHSATERPTLISVCFDPDEDPPEREFEFFRRAFKPLARDSTSELSPLGKGEYEFRKSNRVAKLRPAPWRSTKEPATLASLPNHHCLERVLIGGILEAMTVEDIRWAETSTRDLLKLVGDHGWKRAFRLWNARIKPNAEAFVDALVQEAVTKEHCLAALRATEAWQIVREMVEEP